MPEVAVATFNIRNSRGLDRWNSWPFRRRNTLAVIRALDADVVCLQEVRIGQLRWLARRLRTHDVVAIGRDDGAHGGEHMVTFVRRGRVDIVGHEARWFTDDHGVPGRHPDAVFNRFALAVTVRVDGLGLVVVNTHLDEKSADARADAVRRMAGWFAEGAVVAGDFNCTIDDPVLGPFRDSGFVDALAHLPAGGPGAGTHHYFTATTDETRIDHVFVSRDVGVRDGRIIHDRPRGPLPSDHWPVRAVVEF